MIDFNNASLVKLRPVNDNAFEKMVAPILLDGDDTKVGKDNTVANALEAVHDFLTAYENRGNHLLKCIVVDGAKLHKRSVIKINHCMSSFLS